MTADTLRPPIPTHDIDKVTFDFGRLGAGVMKDVHAKTVSLAANSFKVRFGMQAVLMSSLRSWADVQSNVSVSQDEADVYRTSN